MAGTYLPAKVLDLCTSSCNGVTGIQAWQGRKVWTDAEDVETDVRALTAESEGRIWLWVQSRQGQTYSWQPFVVTIMGELLLRLDIHQSSACDVLYDKVEEIAKALDNASQFALVPAIPFGVTWEMMRDTPEDGVARFEFTANFKVGPNCEA